MNSSALERHDLRLAVVAIILPAEGDVGAVVRLIRRELAMATRWV